MAARKKNNAPEPEATIADLGEPVPEDDIGGVAEEATISDAKAQRLSALDPESAAKAAKAKRAAKVDMNEAKWGRAVGPGDWDETVLWLRKKAAFDGCTLYLRTTDPPSDLPPVTGRQVPTGDKLFTYLAERYSEADRHVRIEWRVYANGRQRRIGEITLMPMRAEEEEEEAGPPGNGGYGGYGGYGNGWPQQRPSYGGYGAPYGYPGSPYGQQFSPFGQPPQQPPQQPQPQAAPAQAAPVPPQPPQPPFQINMPPMPPMPPPGPGFDMQAFMQWQQMRDKMLFEWLQSNHQNGQQGPQNFEQFGQLLRMFQPFMMPPQAPPAPAAAAPTPPPTQQESLRSALQMLAEAKAGIDQLSNLVTPPASTPDPASAAAAANNVDTSPVQVLTAPDGTTIAVDRATGDIKMDQTLMMGMGMLGAKVLEALDKYRSMRLDFIKEQADAAERIIQKQNAAREQHQPPPTQLPPTPAPQPQLQQSPPLQPYQPPRTPLVTETTQAEQESLLAAFMEGQQT